MPLSGGARIIALAAALLLAAAAPARAQLRCAELRPQLAFGLEMIPAELSHARGIADLRVALGRSDDAHPRGLYSVEIVRRTQVAFRTVESGGRVCVAVSEVGIQVTMKERAIFMARELDPQSCRYHVTLAHERQHEQIDEDFLRNALSGKIEVLRAEFPVLATRNPVRAAERDATVRGLTTRAQEIVDRLFDQVLEERDRVQRTIDTPAEYARLGAICP